MNNLDFYTYTKKTLSEIAKNIGLSEQELDQYYELTDKKCKALNGFKETQLVFAQIAKHASNATMITSIVNFDKKIGFLKSVTCDFNAKNFIDKFEINENRGVDNETVDKIVEELRKGLKWNSDKSNEKNRDSIAKRYSKTLIEAAIYVSKFKSRNEVLQDLLEHYKDHNIRSVVDYFRKNIKNGYSVALTCDFLKEFDTEFNDIAKPDVHILDVMNKKNNKIYNKNKKKDLYECLYSIRDIVEVINDKVKGENLTVYKLDRMIWLICSNNFFLHDISNPKQKYLNGIE